MPLRLLALCALAMVVLTGCGSSSANGPMIEPGPTVVGTVSADVAKAAIIRDVARGRGVMDRSVAANAVNALYALIDRAGAEKNVARSAAMLRTGVPPIIRRFEADYPTTLAQLRALRFQTQAGEQIRRFDIDLLTRWHRLLPGFAVGVTRSRTAWGAVVRFGAQNNKLNVHAKQELTTLVNALPAAQRQVLEKAVSQTYGK